MSPVSPVYGSSIEESHTLPFPRMPEMRVVFWARQTMALHLRTKISPNLADPMAEVVVDAVQCPEKMILYSHEKEVASDLMAFLKELCSLDLVVVHLGRARHRTSRIKLISPPLVDMVSLQQHFFCGQCIHFLDNAANMLSQLRFAQSSRLINLLTSTWSRFCI